MPDFALDKSALRQLVGIASASEFVGTTDAQTFITGAKTFNDGLLKLRNPADTINTVVKSGAQVTSDKTFTFPVTASDTIDTIAATATLTNKTLTTPIISSISNTGTVTLPTATTTLVGTDTTDTLTNKTIDSRGTGNVLTGITQDPIVKRTGFAVPVNAASPSATNMMALTGTLNSMTGVGAGTNTMTYDTTEGLVANYITTATTALNAGLISPASTAAMCRTVFAGKIRARFKIDAVASSVSRVWFGVVAVNALPISDTPMASGTAGILVGHGSADTNYQIYQNDATGAATVTAVTGPVAKNTNYHTVEINWPTGGASVNVIFDGTTQNLTTNIPLTTSDLWVNCVGQTATAAIRTFSIHSVWSEFEK